MSKIRDIVREEVNRVLSEDDPCWDNYTMVGMKMKDGEEVPNCVPEEDAESYEESLSEVTTTLNVPGYNTPYAFAPQDDEDEEDLEERLAALNSEVGYTDLNELTTPEALQDFIAYFGPYMMQNQEIAEKIKRNFLRPVNELRAKTGVGGMRTAEKQGKVFRVGNPNANNARGDASLAVDAVVQGDDVEVVRILGLGTGKPPDPPVRNVDFIEREIARGNAEEIDVPFMADA